mmetsp:Transcript_20809/g.30825  ORF Transcript_20809/g.30825 Transcript_20809/m.30825 type:complete len:241 (-) Transcript_20809:15-737(-)
MLSRATLTARAAAAGRTALRRKSLARAAFHSSQSQSVKGASALGARAVFTAAAGLALGASALTLAQGGKSECLFSGGSKQQIPHEGVPGSDKERTFLAIKPDGVQRGLIGKIIARFEERGYQLVGLKMVWPTKKKAEEHYADLSKKPFFSGLTSFFSSGPIVCMCWQGKDVIKQGRAMLGETDPLASKPGSIRGDYSIALGRNIIHGSDGPESAKHELTMWFDKDELLPWKKTVDEWVYE